jgi:GNAT superfamily N-acetyltransferase
METGGQTPAQTLIRRAKRSLDNLVDLDLIVADDDRVTVESLFVHKRRAGLGSKTMHMLCDLADELGVHLELQAMPTDNNISHEELQAFYHQFGFVLDAVSGWMVR